MLLLPHFFLAWGLVSKHRLFLSAGLGICLLLLSTVLAGRFTHDLGTALAISAGVAAALGIGLALFDKQKNNSLAVKLSPALLLYGLIAGALAVLVARVAWLFLFHDQMPTQGHMALVASLLRGNFPPHLMAFPDIALKYHFGGDLLSAIFSWTLGISNFRAIDLTQISGWILMSLGVWALARENKIPAAFTVPLLLWAALGGGWAYLLKPWLDPSALSFAWPHSYVVFGRHLNPGTISNFFMLPYSLGMGLWFVYLVFFSIAIKQSQRKPWILAALVLASLALVQVTFFATLLLVSLEVLLVQAWKDRSQAKRCLQVCLLLALLSTVLALAMGGFFTSSASYSSGLLQFQWPPGYLRNATVGTHAPLSLRQSWLWYMATFGSMVFLAPLFSWLSLASLKKNFDYLTAFLLLYAWQSFLLPQFFQYRLSWDIIKWFTGFHLAMPLLIVLIWSRVSTRKFLVSAMLGILLFLDILPSLRFLLDLGWKSPATVHQSYRRWWTVAASGVGPEFEPLFKALKSEPWDELVLSDPAFSEKIARSIGQAMAQVDPNTVSFGVRAELLQQRSKSIERLKKNFSWEDFESSSIEWIVFSCQEFQRQFSPSSQQAISQAVSEGRLQSLSYSQGPTCLNIFKRTPAPPRL